MWQFILSREKMTSIFVMLKHNPNFLTCCKWNTSHNSYKANIYAFQEACSAWKETHMGTNNPQQQRTQVFIHWRSKESWNAIQWQPWGPWILGLPTNQWEASKGRHTNQCDSQWTLSWLVEINNSSKCKDDGLLECKSCSLVQE